MGKSLLTTACTVHCQGLMGSYLDVMLHLVLAASLWQRLEQIKAFAQKGEQSFTPSQSTTTRKPTDFAKPPLIGGKAESRRDVASDTLPVQGSGTHLSPATSRH